VSTLAGDFGHGVSGINCDIRLLELGRPGAQQVCIISGEGEPVIMRHGRSVLCIGSNPVLLNLRCALLNEHGWRVFSSGSGHEGIRRFGQEEVDAVVIDLNEHGTEAALITGELKRKKPEIPVILLVTDERKLAPGATKQVDAVVARSEEISLLPEVLPRLVQC
jgi:CheY-like chemotaxis protein